MPTWRSGPPRIRPRHSSAGGSPRSPSRSMRARNIASRGTIADLRRQQWIAPDDSLASTSVAQWMRSQLPDGDIALRADSLVAMRQAALAGLGLAALPCYLGDTSPGLRLRASADRGDGDGALDPHARRPAAHRAHSGLHRICRQRPRAAPAAARRRTGAARQSCAFTQSQNAKTQIAARLNTT